MAERYYQRVRSLHLVGSTGGGTAVMEATRRRLSAIVCADVAGYSRLMGADEAGTLAALKDQRRVVDPIIAARGGRIVKTTGDGMLLEFPSIVDAVRAAIDAQRAMAEQNAGTAEARQMRFRIGVHLGDVIVEGDDIFGDGVNVAARLQELAEPGGLCLSQAVYDSIRNKLDAAFADGGVQVLKNIAELVRIWRWVAEAVPPVASLGGSPPLEPPDRPSIAVLPFTNMSGDPEQEYFCDGMAEDIITALSRFRSLFVIARNSSFTYKGRAVDVRQVGRELGVRYVLEGSVRKAANRVRLTAQLVEVANGNHVWADRYEGMVEDVFDLQDRTTEAVVGILEPAILAAEIERARSKRPDSLAAYDHYLRAQALSPLFSREANREMLSHCLKAIALDLRYAPAIALAALAHLQNYAQGWSGDEASDRAEGLRLAEQALLADRSDPFILAVAGHSVAWFARDLGRAIAYLDEATTVNTNHTHALWASGIVRLRAGQVDRALEHLNRALRLSPRDLRSFIVFAAQAEAHHLRGDLGEAVAVAQRAVQHNPNYLPGWRTLAASAARLGQEIVARQAAERLMVLNPAFTVGGFVRRYPYSAPEMWQSYFDGLRQAGVPE